MRRFLPLALAMSGSVALASGPAALRSFRWRVVQDTMRLELEFSGGRPLRYRIRPTTDGSDRKAILVEIAGAKLDSGGLRNLPGWFHDAPGSDASTMAFQLDLERPTPWRASWKQDVLQVDLLNRVYHRPVWKNPWVVGATGVGLAAGGVAYWVLSSDKPASPQQQPPASDDIIPPPNIAFPK